MDLARAPRRTACKKGSGYENGRGALAKSITGYHKNMVREQYPVLELWPIRCQFDMDLARAPRRARSNAHKKGSGYENDIISGKY